MIAHLAGAKGIQAVASAIQPRPEKIAGNLQTQL
jgi:hypothetical protein